MNNYFYYAECYKDGINPYCGLISGDNSKEVFVALVKELGDKCQDRNKLVIKTFNLV